jgi:hypothetical protein
MCPCAQEGGFGILGDEAGQTKLLDMLCDDSAKDFLLGQFARHASESGVDRWARVEAYAKK